MWYLLVLYGLIMWWFMDEPEPEKEYMYKVILTTGIPHGIPHGIPQGYFEVDGEVTYFTDDEENVVSMIATRYILSIDRIENEH